LGVENIRDGGQISVGEDEAGVAVHVVTDNVEMRAGLPVSLACFVVSLFWIGLLSDVCNGGLELGVLSHDHLCVDSSKSFAHNANLFGSYVIDLDEKALGVRLACILEFRPSGGLGLFLGSLGHFGMLFEKN